MLARPEAATLQAGFSLICPPSHRHHPHLSLSGHYIVNYAMFELASILRRNAKTFGLTSTSTDWYGTPQANQCIHSVLTFSHYDEAKFNN
jgi:hypothetical protein